MNKTFITTAIVAGLISGYSANLKAEDKKAETTTATEKMKCNCEKMQCKMKKNKKTGKKEMACGNGCCAKKDDAAAPAEAAPAADASKATEPKK